MGKDIDSENYREHSIVFDVVSAILGQIIVFDKLNISCYKN